MKRGNKITSDKGVEKWERKRKEEESQWKEENNCQSFEIHWPFDYVPLDDQPCPGSNH